MGENRGTATLPATSLGRPLDAEISRAILEAALHILGEKGYSRLTVGEVASRAGVHKPALYRRWGSKLDLVIAAIATLAIDTHDPQTGDVRSDLTELLVASAAANAPQRLDLALRLRAELAAEPELAGAVEARIAGPRRTFVRRIIERAVERGQLRADTDPDLLIEILFGPLQIRACRGAALTRRDAESIVEVVLRGCGTNGRADG